MNHHQESSRQPPVTPMTFYDELAVYGDLEEFIRTFFADRMERDSDFKERILGSLMRFSPRPSDTVDTFVLEQLLESLTYFLEYTKECRTPRRRP